MVKVVLDIKRWGNGLGIRLPSKIVKGAHLKVDQRVCITVDGDAVTISPYEPPLTLEQRLEKFDSAKHGGEVMATTAIGSEKW